MKTPTDGLPVIVQAQEEMVQPCCQPGLSSKASSQKVSPGREEA